MHSQGDIHEQNKEDPLHGHQQQKVIHWPETHGPYTLEGHKLSKRHTGAQTTVDSRTLSGRHTWTQTHNTSAEVTVIVSPSPSNCDSSLLMDPYREDVEGINSRPANFAVAIRQSGPRII